MQTPSTLEAARLIATGELSALELVEHSLGRIEDTAASLNAFVHLDAPAARAAAIEVDRMVGAGRVAELGPLAGVPFGVKDLEDCAGMPTTRGSRWFAGRGPESRDSIHVGRLRAAGAIPLGKTATPEFGAWAYTASPLLGVTRNPWDPSRTPGGSSGGSAAAVAAGLVPFATASDGGGSIRTPAAFCGLVGLRPCYGRIPTFGDTHVAQNAVVGAVTTTVGDTAALLGIMAGHDARDRTSLPTTPGFASNLDELDLSGLRVGFSPDLGFAVADPAVVASARNAASRLAGALGVPLHDVDLRLEDYTRIYALIEGVDRFVGLDESLWTERLGDLDPRVLAGWAYFPTRTLPQQAAIETQRRVLVHRVAEIFTDLDLLLTPTAGIEPFAAEGPMPEVIAGQDVHAGMSVVYSFLASLVNLPAVSLPAALGTHGLPVGLQVIGPRHREDLVLAVARCFELESPWPRHAPGY